MIVFKAVTDKYLKARWFFGFEKINQFVLPLIQIWFYVFNFNGTVIPMTKTTMPDIIAKIPSEKNIVGFGFFR